MTPWQRDSRGRDLWGLITVAVRLSPSFSHTPFLSANSESLRERERERESNYTTLSPWAFSNHSQFTHTQKHKAVILSVISLPPLASPRIWIEHLCSTSWQKHFSARPFRQRVWETLCKRHAYKLLNYMKEKKCQIKTSKQLPHDISDMNVDQLLSSYTKNNTTIVFIHILY